MLSLAVASSVARDVARLYTEAGGTEEVAFQINFFWIIAQAGSFLLFLVILYLVAFRRIGTVLEDRRATVEQGLKDADAARQEREKAADERQRIVGEARREANDIVGRAQRAADETREREVTATREEIERLREQAAGNIESERQRAMADVRGQVADLALAAAGRVVGETMTGERERRLVGEFLTHVDAGPATGRQAAEQPG